MDSPDDPRQFRAQQLQTAIEHLGSRSWRMAEVQCRILLAVDPTDIEGMLILGLAIAASGEASRAAPILDRVRRARPDHADPCRDFANMEPRVPRALVTRQYRACLRLASKDTRLRHDFASYLLENSAPDAALTVLRDAPEVSGHQQSARHGAGRNRQVQRGHTLLRHLRQARSGVARRLVQPGHDAEDRGPV